MNCLPPAARKIRGSGCSRPWLGRAAPRPGSHRRGTPGPLQPARFAQYAKGSRITVISLGF